MSRLDRNLRASEPVVMPQDQERFLFVLLPGFSALDLGAAVETLSAANMAATASAYSWQIVSEAGEDMMSGSGMTVRVDGPLPDPRRRETVILCGGLSVQRATSVTLKAWLRRAVRMGARVGALGGGALTLADTGLSEGHDMSVHWKLQPAMTEAHPTTSTTCSVFARDRARMTSGGGVATLDLFLTLVADHSGNTVATHAADLLLCANVRKGDERQTLTDLCRIGVRNEELGTALQIMRESIEVPLSPSTIADQVGLSTRQLERLFSRHLGVSPKSYFTRLRLERARVLLQQTDMRITEIAMACGFGSPTHFSKHYRRQFGILPSSEQGIVGAQG